jgi:iron complex outermembrane receptor protein
LVSKRTEITEKIRLIHYIRFLFLIISQLLPTVLLFAQTNSDSVKVLEEVVVTIYPGESSLLRSPATVSILNETQLKEQPGYSLVPVMNSLPGVRMEERSPGSYRLSIRGSVVRSPFGVRNVKFYVEDFPLTDASGNTYLNSIDPGSIRGIEVLKGPEGSVFGSNTGGVVLLRPLNQRMDSTETTAQVSTGSFGLFNEKVTFDKNLKNYRYSINQSYQQSDGYRDNSKFRRNYLQTMHQWRYKPANQIKLLAIYSDLNYRTPGGLTLENFQNNPRAARPPSGPIPGAQQQKAGIHNQTLYGGIMHDLAITKSLRHVVAIFGSHTDFKNPFITNYEIRKENTYGLRTYIELMGNQTLSIRWKWNLGLEWQRTGSEITNYGNNLGLKDTLQAADDVNVKQHFFFTRYSIDLYKRLTVELSASLNRYQYKYRNQYPTPSDLFTTRNLDWQLMPRVAASYKISPVLYWRASVSRGYSPPTIEEIRPSNRILDNNLQPESGWNYETGLRATSNNNRFQADLVFFYFHLNNTIVKRTDSTGNDYYVNAGTTKQPGMELQFSIHLIQPKTTGLFRLLQLRNSFTWYNFSFHNYQIGTEDYSGNKLTGVPPLTIVSSISTQFPLGFFLFAQHNFTDRIPLNDGNTAYANSYHLVQLKGGWRLINRRKFTFELFTGVDNLLNQKYSLGNDLNALAGRYYNAAATRNYYVGMGIVF